MAENIAERLAAAERLDKAVRMRVRGAHWKEIARECGYSSPAAALRAVGVAMADATSRADATVEQYRDEAEMRLSYLLRTTLDMIDDGPTSYDEDGNPNDDRAVRVRVVDEARRLVGDLGKLRGVDKAPVDNGETLTVRVVGIDPEDLV